MKKQKKAESLVWIIVWVFILSFVIIWIWTLIWNSKEIIYKFDKKIELDLLKLSANSIINKLDISSLVDLDTFYLYKDSDKYTIFTWTTNSWYINIDKYWAYISDIENYIWNIYERKFTLKNKKFYYIDIDIKKIK